MLLRRQFHILISVRFVFAWIVNSLNTEWMDRPALECTWSTRKTIISIKNGNFVVRMDYPTSLTFVRSHNHYVSRCLSTNLMSRQICFDCNMKCIQLHQSKCAATNRLSLVFARDRIDDMKNFTFPLAHKTIHQIHFKFTQHPSEQIIRAASLHVFAVYVCVCVPHSAHCDCTTYISFD